MIRDEYKLIKKVYKIFFKSVQIAAVTQSNDE